jgi:hypothetical protein
VRLPVPTHQLSSPTTPEIVHGDTEYRKPELLATGPNQVWSWDITKLRGPEKWLYYYLYVILDHEDLALAMAFGEYGLDGLVSAGFLDQLLMDPDSPDLTSPIRTARSYCADGRPRAETSPSCLTLTRSWPSWPEPELPGRAGRPEPRGP